MSVLDSLLLDELLLHSRTRTHHPAAKGQRWWESPGRDSPQWRDVAAGVPPPPTRAKSREPTPDVPSDWREQEQHGVGCANTFIILWFSSAPSPLRCPPTRPLPQPLCPPGCLQPPTVAARRRWRPGVGSDAGAQPLPLTRTPILALVVSPRSR